MGARSSSRVSGARARSPAARGGSAKDRQSLHGNAPDQVEVAVLLVDVINDMDFPGGEKLAARARPLARNLQIFARACP
jgi:hypothetical protein